MDASILQQRDPEGFQRAIGKPFGRLRRGETPLQRENAFPQKDIVKALTARSQGFCNYFPLSSSAFTLGTSAISVALRGGNSGFISVSVSRRISLTR